MRVEKSFAKTMFERKPDKTEHLFLKLMEQFCDVFSEYIELQIDDCAFLDLVEICVLVGVWNDGDLERFWLRIYNREANAVDANRAFFDGDIVSRSGRVFKSEIPTAVRWFKAEASGGLVDVPLNNVAVQAGVHLHTALEVDFIADGELAEIGLQESFFDGSNGVSFLRIINLNDGQANAIVSD